MTYVEDWLAGDLEKSKETNSIINYLTTLKTAF